ncbi:MAG: type II CRISPR RNA-guided endonuclease Cas9 [Clostridia bacterium]|nr:type II CRISPR RNA-guided endonuclease Cas9 [Clostridia bacterium]
MMKYYVGIDIGTDSVGIACTDEEYRLLRAKGKVLWAVRLFDEANTAEERRMKRTARRRLMRRAQRIDLLQELFEPFVTDKLFFARLNNSGFLFEDKDENLQSPYALFADEGYTDKEFYKTYPTIFHLRKALTEGKQKFDLRLYYLAIHHIVKYRGHFLFEGQEMSEIRDIKRLFDRLNETASDIFNEGAPEFSSDRAEEFKKAVYAKTGLNDKKKECFKLFDVGNDKKKKEIITVLLGGTGKMSVIFDNEEYNSEKICFKGLSAEEFEAKKETFGDDFDYLSAMKSIYDYIVFENILQGSSYISDSMIRLYEKHKSDLRKLKDFVAANYSRDIYNRIFKATDQEKNYANYIGYTKIKKKKVGVPKCKIEDFGQYLKKTLFGDTLKSEQNAIRNELLEEIDNGTFLPKILNSDNGLFPYQINLSELDEILKNLCRDYPAFAEKTDGLSVAEKIRSIHTFRIPYYVGPLNTYGGNAWAVRKKEGRITPWNFDDMIDKAQSNEKFMRRMTNKCTYLYNENVLPKGSIIYQKFCVLNELNNLRINEQKISVKLKQEIYNDLFLKCKHITYKKIREYLVDKGYFTKSEETSISLSGTDGGFKSSMNSYLIMKRILGDFADKHLDICEDIILWHTLNTDKSIVENLIAEKCGKYDEISSKIKELKGLSFKEFGSLSQKFLCGIRGGVDEETGETYNLTETLYNTNKNLNQILYYDKYTFLKRIEEENGEISNDIAVETLKEMGLPPQVRRGVWQALQMVEEYVKVLGCPPEKIFVEVTRGDESKGKNKGVRSVSRKNKIETLYKDINDIESLKKELNREDIDGKLRAERVYLYFKQLGKCAYSGEPIDLNDLDSKRYDVDHILPRSLTKDDSLDNKVLVVRSCNAKKSDTYPVPAEYQSKMKADWAIWKKSGLMSDKKYSLLTRTKPLDDGDYQDFINRQIVTTGQMSKAVAELLKRKYGESTKIVYSKGINVSDFRNKYDIVKCRETNDLHHARDAYLNIAVGNVYDTKFTSVKNMFNKREDDTWRRYNLAKLFDRPVDGAWNPNESLKIVKNTLSQNSMPVTRYAYTENGRFYKETVFKGGDDGIDAPRKENLSAEKYGGFKSLSTAYFAVVQSVYKKGNIVKTIERVPVLIAYRLKNDKNAFINYLTDKVGLKQPQILVEKVKLKTLLEVNKTPVWIAGVTGDSILVHNAVQWYTDSETDKYVKGLVKLADLLKDKKISSDNAEDGRFVLHTNRFGEERLVIEPTQNIELYNRIILQLKKSIYGGVKSIGTFRANMEKGAETFKMLPCNKQAEVLSECIKFLKCNAVTADLSLLGLSNRCGILKINKNITESDIEIIHVSPCGLTVRRKKV